MLFNLQILRGIAAVGVVFYHTGFLLGGDHHTEFFGVSTFFVISGFIMCWITRDDADRFLRKRFERIVPFYWACTFALIFLTFKLPLDLMSWQFVTYLARSLLFLPSLDFPVLHVGWTLNFEIYFYLVFAVALWINQRFAPLIAATFIYGVLLLDSVGIGGFLVHYYSHDYIRYFLYGIAVYYGWVALSRFAPRWPTIIIGITAIVICYGSQFVKPWVPDLTLLAHAPIIIVTSALFLESSGVVVRWRPLVLIGDASYAIYLTHLIFFTMAESHAIRHGETLPKNSVQVMLLWVAASIAIGVCVHLYVEKPMLRRIRNGNWTTRRSGESKVEHSETTVASAMTKG
ncbi:acyltransferase [Bradyrhizobium sp. Tv2a-2]|uniref:acyltransferase family protein n=1 Tax=Bradyrhizobium sp. Tv2a-2 TaxID=113395 RepID=UPI000419BA64|nr:acyltransferase [Bradyrhizobium sp. Tv2a-2]